GEVPLLKHLSGAGPAAARAEDLSGLLVASDAVSFTGDRIGKDIAHRKAVLGITDGRSERALETEEAMVRGKIGEPRDESGDRRDRRALRWELCAEALRIEAVRGRARAVVRSHLARSRVVEEREHVTTDRGAMRHHHRANRRRGDSSVGGVAALTERGETSGCREVMSAR